jgi:hypothetical protein
MELDTNSLFSTIIQSAATFVAIVAGFIFSKLLSLSAERNSLQSRIRDINVQLETQKQDLISLKKKLLEWDVNDFFENSDVLKEIIDNREQASLSKAMKLVYDCNLSEEELIPYWEESINMVENAFRIIEDNFAQFDFDTIEQYLKNLGINLSSYRLNIYLRIYSQIYEKYQRQKGPLGIITALSSSFTLPNVTSHAEANQYRILNRDIENHERTKNAMEIQVSDLNNQLKHLAQPKGSRLGLIFLAYFSLVSIVIPVFDLSFPPKKFPKLYIWIIFLLFLSGLVFFFLYLFKLINQLSENQNSK